MLKEIRVEDDIVSVEWNVKLGGSDKEGYPWGADYRNNKIRLMAGARQSALREHLVHELLHKLWEKCGLGKKYSGKTEEYIISSLTGWLVDTLRENPELVAYITED